MKIIKIEVKETTPTVPQNAKLNVVGQGETELYAVRQVFSEITSSVQVYDYETVEEKAIKAIKQRKFSLADNLSKALASSGKHNDLLLFTTEMQPIIAGQTVEILPLLLSKIKNEWTDGTKRTYEVERFLEKETHDTPNSSK